MDKELESFKKVLDELMELKTKKRQDYGDSWKIFGLQGVLGQVMHKAFRLWNLRAKEPTNEALRDTYRDLAVYCIMGVQLIDNNETEPKV